MAIAPVLASCGGYASDRPRRVESDEELQAQDEREFANSPDVQLPELRRKLREFGITDKEIREALEENEVPIFVLTISDSKFATLDKKALAALLLDSRYRFEMADPEQVRALARYSVMEDAARRKQRYLKELAANDEMDIFPRYTPGSDMTKYARKLELYCGYRPGEAFNVIDGQWLEYRNQMVDWAVEQQRQNKPGLAAFKCIIRIVYATELQPHFIGNRGRSGERQS
ncbi:hypothetical protein G7076_06335 [Sphingomonas sp. HDW15A]|uniref:hypothetical protein n=1 Tax=Sphingomonas sp. HDW15A TaxID=2714942 RepID=UPI00140A79BE|nr:hypothetical protein [Sphingomonas sp. HDW15A]QIK96116.1 hypothetical protein G7076_06335 [Sphingomonas sp. HDW15A]